MTKYIIHEQSDYPNLGVTHIAPNLFNPDSEDRRRLREKGIDFNTDDELIEWVKNKDIQSGAKYIVLDKSQLPTDEYFGEAWEIVEGGVQVSLEKAKNVHLNKLRKIRSQKFIDLGFPSKLNPQIENAILDDETKSKLKDLRDFPQNLDLTNVTDHLELKSMIPDCLK